MIQTAVRALHFPPDAKDVFGPAADVGGYVVLRQFASEFRLELIDKQLSFVALLVENFCDVLISLGLEIAKCQVLQFPFELPDA